MKALVKAHAEPGLWLHDVPEPTIGPNDLLIRISRTAVCGTDLHIYNWDHWASQTIRVPMTVGHEFVGTVVDMGSEVRGYTKGDRVSGEGHITCGFCRNCKAGRRHLCRATEGVGVNRTGCFAEYLSLPAQNGYRLPDEVDDDIASMLDPLGNAVHTALSFPLVGEDVLITGAGPIGAMAAAVARFCGARHIVVTDVNDYRLSLAKAMGATRVVNVSHESIADTMRELDMQEGFDVGLEMSGNADAMRSQLELAVHGGHIAVLGIPPDEVATDWHAIIFKGLMIKGVYGREMFETWYKMVNMLRSGLDVRPIITHRFDYVEFQQGFDVLRSGESGKVVFNWT